MNTLLKNLTIVIPFRVDSHGRLENLKTILRWMSAWNCAVIVLEGAEKATLNNSELQQLAPNVLYVYREDHSPVFHRTRYINQLMQQVKTPLVGVWDADVVVEETGVAQACAAVLANPHTLAYPYDGRFIMHTKTVSNLFQERQAIHVFDREKQSCLGRPSYGGAYIVYRDYYGQIGGENERFVGWGPEDAERLYRCQILGWQIFRAKQFALHHLYHPRSANNLSNPKENLQTMREELLHECSCTAVELQQYIKDTYTWKSLPFQ